MTPANPDNNSFPVNQPEAVDMFDPDGALSRAFLLRRGACCEYDCQNCPYRAERRGQIETD